MIARHILHFFRLVSAASGSLPAASLLDHIKRNTASPVWKVAIDLSRTIFFFELNLLFVGPSVTSNEQLSMHI